jgi:hypothetical protein
MTLITSDELIAYMGGVKLTPKQLGITEMVILPGVQQELENYLNRPVEPVIVREAVRANETGFLYFRVTPIHEIRSVALSDGTNIPLATVPASEVVNPDQLRTMEEWGVPELYGYQLTGYVGLPSGYYPAIGMGRPFYRVEYIAGYNGFLNEALKLDVLRVSAREVEMQFDDSMSLRGGQTEAASDSDNREKGWTQPELQKWDRLRRRVAV